LLLHLLLLLLSTFAAVTVVVIVVVLIISLRSVGFCNNKFLKTQKFFLKEKTELQGFIIVFLPSSYLAHNALLLLLLLPLDFSYFCPVVCVRVCVCVWDLYNKIALLFAVGMT
jgi:hypothetical protein